MMYCTTRFLTRGSQIDGRSSQAEDELGTAEIHSQRGGACTPGHDGQTDRGSYSGKHIHLCVQYMIYAASLDLTHPRKRFSEQTYLV